MILERTIHLDQSKLISTTKSKIIKTTEKHDRQIIPDWKKQIFERKRLVEAAENNKNSNKGKK